MLLRRSLPPRKASGDRSSRLGGFLQHPVNDLHRHKHKHRQTFSRLRATTTTTEREVSAAYLSGVVARRLLHLLVETSGRFQVLRRDRKKESARCQNSLQVLLGVVGLFFFGRRSLDR